jgi:asparagine synthase (glutamine-hydrolysing)
LRSFSIAFADPEYDETAYQQLVADFLGTDHRTTCCSSSAIAAVLPDVIWHAEKPLLRTAPAPMFLLSKLVRDQGFKVVLTGEGADEMFGGYDLFKEAKVRRFCAAQPDSAFRANLFRRLYPYLPKLQAQSPAYRRAFFRVRGEELSDPFFSHRPRWEVTAQLKRFFSPEMQAMLAGHDAEAEARELLPPEYSSWHPLCQAQFLETAILLPGYILSSQGDRMAMAHSIEARFPFLDYRVAEFASRLPPRWKMKAIQEKHLLKQTFKRLVPPAVIERKKQPYRAPDAQCFFDADSRRTKQEYVDELLSPKRIQADGWFQPDAVSRLVEKARQGKVVGTKDNMALVGILSTQLLTERFIRSFPSFSQASQSPTMPIPIEVTQIVGA